MSKKAYQLIGLLVLAIFMIALPWGLKSYQQDFMITLLIWVMVACSYRLMTLTGEFSLIHVVLMGAGAYTSALLAKLLHLSVWLAMPCGGIASALLAAVLSFPLFRMSGLYFLIGSFAAGEAIRLSWIYFDWPFGGPFGIKLIPSPVLWLPGMGKFELWQAVPYYYLVLVVCAISLFILYRLEKSRLGLTMNAIHWRDALAESVGVDTWHYRTLSFIVASFFAGIAGALFGHYFGTVNPVQFDVSAMVLVLIWVIVGGMNTFAGPIIGTTLLMILNEFFRSYAVYRPLIYGAILIAAMFFLPDGLESLPGKVRDWYRRRRGPDQAEVVEAN